jgi:hypothetical protein
VRLLVHISRLISASTDPAPPLEGRDGIVFAVDNTPYLKILLLS